MNKLLATVAVIAALASPAYAYDFLFNGVSGTAISATYFVSATAMSLNLDAVTPTGVTSGTIAINSNGAPCILSATTWVRLVSPATACGFSPASPL